MFWFGGRPGDPNFAMEGIWQHLLEGSWDLVTIYNWGYRPTHNWIRPFRGLISRVISPVISSY